jgi:small conductance mechanosensitive channel
MVDTRAVAAYVAAMHIDLSVILHRFQEMLKSALTLLPNVLLGALTLTIFYFVAKLVRRTVRKLTARFHHNAGLVFGRLAQFSIVILGLLVALSIVIPSFKAGDVVGLLGIGSVAIGFAFRDILQNFLAGILLLLIEPFRIGDQIVVAGFEGTVDEIQTRATLLRTYDGRRVVIPNATIFTQAVTVNTAFEKRRMEYDVGVGYGDDLDSIEKIVLEAVRSVDGVLADPPPDALVVALAGSQVNLRVRWWTSGPQRTHVLEVQSAVLKIAKKALTARGVDLPFPTQQILFHDQTEETDGDRAHQREGWPSGKSNPAPRGIARAIQDLTGALRDRSRAP